MKASDIAAWVGATTGTLAVGLEFVKWIRSGPRLRIAANSSILPFDPTPEWPAQPHLVVWVRNVGNAPTTLTGFAFTFYASRIDRRLRLEEKSDMILEPVPESLLRVLAPGEQWTSLVRSSPLLDDARRGGVICRRLLVMPQNIP